MSVSVGHKKLYQKFRDNYWLQDTTIRQQKASEQHVNTKKDDKAGSGFWKYFECVRFHELEIDITVEKRWNLKESDRDLEGSRKFSGRFHGRNQKVKQFEREGALMDFLK